MDPADLIPADLPAQARPLVEAYLRVLAAGLPPGRRHRAAQLAEIADGLACAVEVRLAQGAHPAIAGRQAAAEFGDPRELARELSRQATALAAHRLGTMLVLTGPLVGLAWIGAYAADSGTGWPQQTIVLLTSANALPLLLGVAVIAALIAAAGHSRVPARLHVPAHPAALAGAIAAACCTAADLTLLMGAHAHLGWSPALAVAAAASVLRLSAAAAAATHLTRLQALCR